MIFWSWFKFYLDFNILIILHISKYIKELKDKIKIFAVEARP